MPLFGGAFLFFCSPIAFFLSDNRKNVASAFLSDGCLMNVTFLCNIFHYYRKKNEIFFLKIHSFSPFFTNDFTIGKEY